MQLLSRSRVSTLLGAKSEDMKVIVCIITFICIGHEKGLIIVLKCYPSLHIGITIILGKVNTKALSM